MRPYVAELARIADCYVSCYPNAGLPNAFGEYDERPADTGGYLHEFAASGFVNIVGGCCGTTPDHIRGDRRKAWRAAARGSFERVARRPRIGGRFTQFAGLETLTIRPDSTFQMIGERTERHRLGCGSRGSIRAGDLAEAATRGARPGARRRELVDVNMDEGMLDSEQAMTEFLNYIATEPEIARVPDHDRQLEVVGDPGRA